VADGACTTTAKQPNRTVCRAKRGAAPCAKAEVDKSFFDKSNPGAAPKDGTCQEASADTVQKLDHKGSVVTRLWKLPFF